MKNGRKSPDGNLRDFQTDRHPDLVIRAEKKITARVYYFLDLLGSFLQFSSNHITHTSHLKKKLSQSDHFEILYVKI